MKLPVTVTFTLLALLSSITFIISCKNNADSSQSNIDPLLDDWVAHTESDADIRFKDANPTLHGVTRKQFATLDKYVARFDEHYPDGITIRESFYNKFSDYDDYNRNNAAKYTNKYLTNLKEWRDIDPKAPTPWICLAKFEIHLAWAARGNSYADKVTEEGWEKFGNHIKNSEEYLTSAPESVKSDPEFYQTALTLALAQGWDYEDAEAMFLEGQDVDPLYVPLYTRMAYYLQPKWHGENPDDWSRWLEHMLKHEKLTEEDRLVIYGYVVRENIRGNYSKFKDVKDLYKYLGINRNRFLKGLAAYAKRYPDSKGWPSYYLYHACMAGDQTAMQEAIKMMDGKYLPGALGGEKGFLEILKDLE